MGNMARSSNPVLAADSDIQLHVEGITDEEVIKDRWIKDHAELRRAFSDFKSYSEDGNNSGQGSSGCAALVKRLASSLDLTDVIAMGLADRDLLRTSSAIDVFLETDDDEFRRRAMEFLSQEGISRYGVPDLGGRLWVLHRWEIENYLLLDVELITHVWNDNAKAHGESSPASNSSETSAALLALADEGLPRFAAELSQIRKAQPLVANAERGASNSEQMREAMRLSYPNLKSEELDAENSRIRAFGQGYAEATAERWDRLSRVVDGKWMLGRIANRWIKGWSKEQLRRNLARMQALKMQGPPGEILDVLTEMRKKARAIGRQEAVGNVA